MIKSIIVLLCLSFSVQAGEVTKVPWPSKAGTAKTESISFDSYTVHFKHEIIYVYFDSHKATALLFFKNNNEISISSPANNKALNDIKKSDYLYYENNQYTAYFKTGKRPEYSTAILIPKVKNDFVTDLIIAGYYNQSDMEFILSLL